MADTSVGPACSAGVEVALGLAVGTGLLFMTGVEEGVDAGDVSPGVGV